MPRKNHRNSRVQAFRRHDGLGSTRTLPPPPPLEGMIVPHGRCHWRHHKPRFLEHEIPAALKQACAGLRSKGQFAGLPTRGYHCKTEEGGCGFWHLTSQTEDHKRGRI